MYYLYVSFFSQIHLCFLFDEAKHLVTNTKMVSTWLGRIILALLKIMKFIVVLLIFQVLNKCGSSIALFLFHVPSHVTCLISNVGVQCDQRLECHQPFNVKGHELPAVLSMTKDKMNLKFSTQAEPLIARGEKARKQKTNQPCQLSNY
jgi:hypothetical protein